MLNRSSLSYSRLGRGVIDSVRAPAHLRSKALEIGAQKWVKARTFRRQEWFKSIDTFIEGLSQLTGTNAIEHQILVNMIAAAIGYEPSLENHVTKLQVPIEDSNEWAKMCTAAAWVVLSEYLNDLTKRESA